MVKNTEKQIEDQDQENDGVGSHSSESQSPSDNQGSRSDMQSLSDQDDSNQISSSSSPVEAAIKTMKFRNNRGSKMKQLLKGNISHDAFWEKHSLLFGGDLRLKEEEEDEEDYEQSSSGRDEFDSDFNNTDSYPGKRGRKKGTKIKKRKDGTGKKRGRPKKQIAQKSEQSSQKKEDKIQRPKRGRNKQVKKQIEDSKRKIIYKRAHEKPEDYFLILKATIPSKRGRKPKALILRNGVEQSKQNQ